MAKISLPERGQPLDVTYIYELAEALNSLDAIVSSSTNNSTTIDVPGTQLPQTIKTSGIKIIGGYKEIVSNTSVIAGTDIASSYPYLEFKYPPMIVATVKNIGGTVVGSNTNVVLQTITTSRVDFTVHIGTSGMVSLAVNLIIIGIPN